MRTNELCTTEQVKRGYSAHYIGFGIQIYYKGQPFMQVATEKELGEIVDEDDWWFNDGTTYGR
jgi:hypothetical protein